VTATKAKAIMALLLTRPAEAFDRTVIALQRRLEKEPPNPVALAEGSLEKVAGFPMDVVQADPVAHAFEKQVLEVLQTVASKGPMERTLDADFSLAHLCFALCRALKPKVFVETGVAHGITSAFILKAMEQNGCGELWSIDLPPLVSGASSFVGVAVPKELRSRWHLVRGASRRHLPKILARYPHGIDIFLHDSLHTYRNMSWEFETVWQRLNCLMVADDVEQNAAFQDFVSRVRPNGYCTVKELEKTSFLGVAVKAPATVACGAIQ
jgi:methyltransferase family protein